MGLPGAARIPQKKWEWLGLLPPWGDATLQDNKHSYVNILSKWRQAWYTEPVQQTPAQTDTCMHITYTLHYTLLCHSLARPINVERLPVFDTSLRISVKVVCVLSVAACRKASRLHTIASHARHYPLTHWHRSTEENTNKFTQAVKANKCAGKRRQKKVTLLLGYFCLTCTTKWEHSLKQWARGEGREGTRVCDR